jgi:citrate lyase subunit beta/citryl-CoA lyase
MNLGSGFVAPLFVPGNRPERFEKAAASGADAIIIDLEDAVAADAKAGAREALGIAVASCPIFVRINGASTPWHHEDLAAAARLPLAGIVLPKAQSAAEIAAAAFRCRGKPLRRGPSLFWPRG